MPNTIHIVIVDDSPEDRALVRRTLLGHSGKRWRFSEADSGEQALALCQQVPAPDVMLLDMDLPDMTGLEILEALTDEDGQISLPVVVLTGLMSSKNAEIALAAGAQDFFQKSFLDSQMLSQIITNSVERYRLQAKQREFESSLARALRNADTANQAKSEFLANMSHEIRTPMTAILGYADLLAARLQDPDDLTSLDAIKRNGQHLLELINDILDLSKVESGKLELRLEQVNLPRLLADVRSLMGVRAQEKNIPLTVEYRSRIPQIIVTDATRLRQILINLLGNAIKFTEHGEVKLAVDFSADKQPQLTLAVIDTGIGIAADEQLALFQPFSQGSEAHRYGGTGLGLVVSQRLATLLGGEITVSSRPREGSTFSLTIPVDTAGAELVDAPCEAVALSLSAQPALPTLSGRVLVADDRLDIRYLLQGFIEQAGASAIGVKNGAAAVAAVQAAEAAGQPVDAVVMDMHMPVQNGFQATQELRAAGFQRPIIALTASVMAGERTRCLEAGCDVFLSKPVEARALIAALAKQLSKPRSSDSPPESPPAGLSENAADSLHVLLVEDNEDARKATARLLQLAGFQVSAADNGASALQLTGVKRPPDVALVDINLPDMDGYALVQQLKMLPGTEHMRFIALSGQAPDCDLSAAGCFDQHLLKPVGLSELLAVLPASGSKLNPQRQRETPGINH